jgi:DNA helicase-2/ATP-dependent DNA helicase PcrA
MTATENEWEQEQRRVDWVIQQIDRQTQQLEDQVGEMTSQIVEIRRNFWDDVTVNFDDLADTLETYAGIKQQADLLSEKERQHQRMQTRLQVLRRLRESPYFGRIDFLEDGQSEAERIYIGVASLRDERGEDFLVYDWRAPIASLYYDYPPGPAQYNTPSGIITGELQRKRQFMIRGGRIESMFDTGMTIGDELLQKVLGRHSDAQMHNIVATIQKEQNRAIRDDRSRLLIVQGVAGSGKTSVALQRVAYLLYRHRQTIRSDQILLFSPNPMFNSYVRTVLPELGEQSMQQTTFFEYLEHRLGRRFTLEDPFSQLEYVYTAMAEPGYDARIAGIRYKASRAFLDCIDRYVMLLGQEGMVFRDVKFRGEPIVSAKEIREVFYALDRSWSIPNRLSRLVEWLLQRVRELAEAQKEKPWVEEEMELLSHEEYLRAHRQAQQGIRRSSPRFDEYAREEDILRDMVIRKHLKKVNARIRRLAFVDVTSMYQRLFEGDTLAQLAGGAERVPEHWQEICRQTLARLQKRELAYEDATPYLYLQERIQGFQTHTSIRYVFVDEAQDYSPFQFAFLRRLFPHAKMTVLGDMNQSIFAHAEEQDSLRWLASLYPSEPVQTMELWRSYRSTRPIVDFTRPLILDGDKIEPFNRDGERPTLTRVSDPGELHAKILARIEQLVAKGQQTIAVICKTAKEAREAYEGLRKSTPVRLIGPDTTRFQPGVHVVPAYLAKGIEFDAVIVYNASAERYGREEERKLLYTACTRAMHELHLYSVGEVSPFIAAVPPGLYEVSE